MVCDSGEWGLNIGCFILGLDNDLLAVCEKFEWCGGVGVILIGICWWV